MAQAVELLLCDCEALSSNSSIAKKKKRKMGVVKKKTQNLVKFFSSVSFSFTSSVSFSFTSSLPFFRFFLRCCPGWQGTKKGREGERGEGGREGGREGRKEGRKKQGEVSGWKITKRKEQK
jgi:hypothetical protein